MPRKTIAKINLEAIKSNYQLAKKLAPNSNNIAVIKANAYGHGSLKVAETLEPMVPAFAVALFEEAVALRDSGISKPILILQGVRTSEEIKYSIANDFWLMLHSPLQVDKLVEIEIPSSMKLWLKLDTGMHRLGLDSQQFITACRSLNVSHQNSQQIILCSHFYCASEIKNSFNQKQLNAFWKIVSSVNKDKLMKTSFANSAAIMGFPDSHLDWNRPGIMLYGVSPFDKSHPNDKYLQPAMSFTSEVIDLHHIKTGESVGYSQQWTANRNSTIATIAVGYADGYPFHAKNGTPLLISGQSANLVGRVSMDLITADVTDCNNVQIGDMVELWGDNVSVEIVAKHSDTIGYELLTGISKRVSKTYI